MAEHCGEWVGVATAVFNNSTGLEADHVPFFFNCKSFSLLWKDQHTNRNVESNEFGMTLYMHTISTELCTSYNIDIRVTCQLFILK